MIRSNPYQSYYHYYLDNFRAKHAHPINRLLHFIGITLTYLTLFYGIFTLSIYCILGCMLPFLALSFIGHKIIQRNEIVPVQDKKYGVWPLRAAFTFTHRVYTGKQKIF